MAIIIIYMWYDIDFMMCLWPLSIKTEILLKTIFFTGLKGRDYEIRVVRPNFIQNEPVNIYFHRFFFMFSKLEILVFL